MRLLRLEGFFRSGRNPINDDPKLRQIRVEVVPLDQLFVVRSGARLISQRILGEDEPNLLGQFVKGVLVLGREDEDDVAVLKLEDLAAEIAG